MTTVRVGLAAVEPLLALPPFLAAPFRRLGFSSLVFPAFPCVLGGGFRVLPTEPNEDAWAAPGGVGFFKLNPVPVPN